MTRQQRINLTWVIGSVVGLIATLYLLGLLYDATMRQMGY